MPTIFPAPAPEPFEIPVLPLRDIVICPHIIVPLYVGRAKSIKAIELAMKSYDKRVILLAQKDPKVEDPAQGDLYHVGTIGIILQFLKLPDGTIKVLMEGDKRALASDFRLASDSLIAQVRDLEEPVEAESSEKEALLHIACTEFEKFARVSEQVPPELLNSLAEVKQAGNLADAIAIHLPLTVAEKQKLLETFDGVKRLELAIVFLKQSMDLLAVKQKLNTHIRELVGKDQRQYYLNQQMKAIQKELGLSEAEQERDEFQQMAKKIATGGMTKEAKEKAEAELKKLRNIPLMSPESTIIRNYLDWLIQVPWKKRSTIKKDLVQAERILDKDHYGLEKVKERIIEFLAVQQRVQKIKGPILCLVGPPGVGKTSLARSIAHTTGRRFFKMSLGGVRDEAEIRGHRRTYVGALPGKIIQGMKKAGTCNPLFLLDEIDKAGRMDFHGDPTAALLEVLDPEQNCAFNDHYLEVDYDLSDVLFIATANTLDIHPALLDRMETIMLSGYTEDEKLNIAIRHLLPKQLAQNGLKASELKMTDLAIMDIIRYYTREAGVRSLERELSKIIRKVVREILVHPSVGKIKIEPANLEQFLGVKKHRFGEAAQDNRAGQVTGLAWTEVGGELLTVEAITMAGKGEAIITGQLGDIMQESVAAARSIVRNRADQFGIAKDFFEKHDIHVHVPEGAVPKDGPSAGVTMCTALVSAITQIPVHADFAMTGEITLRGEVLPIGGLKEKLLAARRGGIKHVIIPEDNVKDLKEIGENVTHDLTIHPVRWIDEVLRLALVRFPEASS